MDELRFEPEQIDRGIKWVLDKAVFNEGYWVDLDLYPEPIDQVAIKAALTALQSGLGSNEDLIQVYGAGAPKSRKGINRSYISIKRNYYKRGDIGYGSTVWNRPVIVDEMNPENNTWEKVREPDYVSNVEYEIRSICNSSKMQRKIDDIMYTAFGIRKYIKGRNEDRTEIENGFWFEQAGTPLDVESAEWVERLYRFDAKDIVVAPAEVIEPGIVSTNMIEVGIAQLKEGEDKDDLDDGDFFIIDIEAD